MAKVQFVLTAPKRIDGKIREPGTVLCVGDVPSSIPVEKVQLCIDAGMVAVEAAKAGKAAKAEKE